MRLIRPILVSSQRLRNFPCRCCLRSHPSEFTQLSPICCPRRFAAPSRYTRMPIDSLYTNIPCGESEGFARAVCRLLSCGKEIIYERTLLTKNILLNTFISFLFLKTSTSGSFSIWADDLKAYCSDKNDKEGEIFNVKFKNIQTWKKIYRPYIYICFLWRSKWLMISNKIPYVKQLELGF